MRSPTVRDLLKSQDCGYTLAISDDGGTCYERISCIRDVLFAPENPAKVISQISDPDTRIVSLTVTEKGYHLEPTSGLLELGSPALQADLAGATGTIYGHLTNGLRKRRDANARPIAILSCDNLNANGSKLGTALRRFTSETDPDLIEYIDNAITFPCCMVDRITPATTEVLIAEVEQCAGFSDRAPVATERYSEWVIEDDFPSGRPLWETAGAVFTDDVAPFEQRKLRLLNGAHSALAYCGLRAGHRFVHEAIADPDLRAMADQIMTEAAETLPSGIRSSAADYGKALIERFTNPHLNHELRQIAMDGSLKLPIRLVASWKERNANGLASPGIEGGISGWIGFALAETAAGRKLQDPAALEIATLCRNAASPAEAITQLLELVGISSELAADSGLLQRVQTQLV